MNLKERNFLRQIGNRIREQRQAVGWTQEELGDRCVLHRTFIGSVERGERNVSILNLRLIATTLRVDVVDLLAPASDS
jgi:transcriptional regulator with XRE-family HTH domain